MVTSNSTVVIFSCFFPAGRLFWSSWTWRVAWETCTQPVLFSIVDVLF